MVAHLIIVTKYSIPCFFLCVHYQLKELYILRELKSRPVKLKKHLWICLLDKSRNFAILILTYCAIRASRTALKVRVSK